MAEHAWICATCAVQQRPSPSPPAICPICADERQYLPPGGQRWTTLTELSQGDRRCDVREEEPDLIGVGVTPKVGIGQRALVVRSGAEGVMFDVPGYIDDDAVRAVRSFCAVRAVTASHPHFYALMAEWARALDAPVLIPEADAQWVQRNDCRIEHWAGSRELVDGVMLVQCGGHFAGSAVVHWAQGADRRGVLLTGDTLAVAADLRSVSVMRSYPNIIPIGEPQLSHIESVLAPLRYDRIYGGWWGDVITSDAALQVQRSLARYRRWIRGESSES